MTPMDDGTLVKLIGDFSEELPEAAYRVVAKNLKTKIFDQLVRLAEEDISGRPEAVERFLASSKGRIFGELVVGFILSAILELTPSTVPLDEQRRKLAYNLRVQSYQDVGDPALARGLAWLTRLWQRGSELHPQLEAAVAHAAALNRGHFEGVLSARPERERAPEEQTESAAESRDYLAADDGKPKRARKRSATR
jgi:hypothetical protein